MNKLILVLILSTVGCANTQILEQSKREAAYRRLLDENQNTTTPTAGTGPLEMPQEWLDQWKK
jgi:hypothetical protein